MYFHRDKKKHKRKQKSKTEHFNLSDLQQRRRAGSEIFDPSLKRVPTEPDEAQLLGLADLDDMKSESQLLSTACWGSACWYPAWVVRAGASCRSSACGYPLPG